MTRVNIGDNNSAVAEYKYQGREETVIKVSFYFGVST